MKLRFAALRFFEDGNLADKIYWYLSEFPLAAGEEALAPVGRRDCLQRAVAERVIETDEAQAPYDLRLIKRVAARYGERKIVEGEFVCFELGGLKYDEKRYTRFRRVLFSQRAPAREARQFLKNYGVEAFAEGTEEELLNAACRAECVLLSGEYARRAAEKILTAVRGGEAGVPAERAERLIRKLC